MKKKQLTVDRWITDKRRNLSLSISYAIKHKQKIHITAPVNTGKTTYAIEIIEKYVKRGYKIIVLEPQIGITSQVKTKLDKKGIPSFVYNSKTWRNLDRWEENNETQVTIYLSTIDSAHYPLTNGNLDPSKTIVISDESHAFLQKARTNFDKTVRAILEAECPVIGFTATESAWVIDYLFKFDSKIRINATGLPEKRISPILIPGSIPNAIATAISSNDYKKLIIWTETIAMQNRIADEIKNECPNKKILVLNAYTRDTNEKDSWDYIMDNDKLPPDINVAIFNSVVQAGININDNDIDYQYLVGQFDPIGFLQYIGRARNYEGEYNFLYNDYGEQLSLTLNEENLDKSMSLLEDALNQLTERQLSLMSSMMPDDKKFYEVTDSGILLNKCIIANRFYEEFRKLHGTELLRLLDLFDPEIIINEPIVIRGYTSSAESKKQYRKANRDKLPKMVKHNALDLDRMIEYYSKGMTHNAALKLVNESTSNKAEAKNNNLLYVPKTRKRKLISTIETAKKASVSMQQIMMAATNYIKKNKNENIIKIVMKLSGKKVEKHINAKKFYSYDYLTNPQIKKTLKAFQSKISECKSAGDWKREIKSHFTNNPLSGIVASSIYENCFITKRSKYKDDDGESVNGQKLISIVHSWDEYKKANGIDF